MPTGPRIVRLLMEAGADPNARTTGGGPGETPLHYAASSDDVDVAAALIDGGADMEAPPGCGNRAQRPALGRPVAGRHR